MVGLLICCAAALPAQAQSKKAGDNANSKVLEVRARKALDGFLRETVDLAKEYESIGDVDQAREMLKTVLKLQPNATVVKAKLKELEEQALSANPLSLEVDVSRGWVATNLSVIKEEPFRIQAAGTYRFLSVPAVDPAGFPEKDPTKADMAPGIPCGALMGVVLVQGKPGKPFAIGTEAEITPKESGLLFLRVNIPPGARCSGRLKVMLSGNLKQ